MKRQGIWPGTAAGHERDAVNVEGHMSFVESPETYLGAVRTFLGKAVA